MNNKIAGRTSGGDDIRSHRWRWLVAGGALAVAMLLSAFVFRPDTVHGQEPGGVYAGTIEFVTASCGGGAISLTVGPDGNDIRTTEITGLMYILPEPIDIVNDVGPGELPIAGGSFVSETPLEGPTGPLVAFIEGSFEGTTLTGTLGVREFQDLCAPTYSAELQEGAAVDEPVPDAEEPTDGEEPATEEVAHADDDTDLPKAGSGPLRSNRVGAIWMLLTAALGALGLALIGTAVIRRRSA